jgi:hypothetical protein
MKKQRIFEDVHCEFCGNLNVFWISALMEISWVEAWTNRLSVHFSPMKSRLDVLDTIGKIVCRV